MIKHIVLFRFIESSTELERAKVLHELSELPARFVAMKNWTMGLNQSSRDNQFTHGFVVEFDDDELLEGYLQSDTHETFVRERFRPIIAQRAVMSYEYTE